MASVLIAHALASVIIARTRRQRSRHQAEPAGHLPTDRASIQPGPPLTASWGGPILLHGLALARGALRTARVPQFHRGARGAERSEGMRRDALRIQRDSFSCGLCCRKGR